MASLTISELRKRNNFGILLKKIQGQQALELIKEKQVQLGREAVLIKQSETLIAGLEKLSQDPDDSVVLGELVKNKCLMLETVDGEHITSGALQKTWEFGSKTSEMVYEKESREQKNIQKVLRNLSVFGLKPVTLVVTTLGGRTYTYENIVGVQNANKVNVGNFKKADFEFVDVNCNVIFNASHKYGKRPRHFRQWSGLKNFHEHPEVKQFGEDLKVALENEVIETLKTKVFPQTLSFGREIQDPNLKKLAIFGNEVDFLIQGRCEFIPTETPSVFELKASMILSKEDDISFLPDSYQPIILARRGDLRRGTFGIKGCRGMVYPKRGRAIHRLI